jgi:hypothetical protein
MSLMRGSIDGLMAADLAAGAASATPLKPALKGR